MMSNDLEDPAHEPLVHSASAGSLRGAGGYVDEEESVISLRKPPLSRRISLFCANIDWKVLIVKNIFILTLVLLLATSLVLVKKVSLRMTNYPFTLAQVQPIITSTLFGICWLCQWIYLRRLKEDPARHLIATVPDPHERIKKRHLAVVGTFLSIGNVLLFTGSRGTYVPGPFSVLLQQTTIPATLAFCIIFFKTKFRVFHFLGAIVILGGVVVALWPTLVHTDIADARVWAMLCIVGAATCNAIGLSYLEYYVVTLQGVELSFSWMWMWINVFEVFTTVPLMLVVAPLQGIAFSDTLDNIGRGYECLFLGIGHHADDDCDGLLYELYLPMMVVFVVSRLNMAYVVYIGSAALMWFAATCAVPLANIAFALPIIMGKNASPFTPWNIAGVVVVVAGLLMFRFEKRPLRSGLDCAYCCISRRRSRKRGSRRLPPEDESGEGIRSMK